MLTFYVSQNLLSHDPTVGAGLTQNISQTYRKSPMNYIFIYNNILLLEYCISGGRSKKHVNIINTKNVFQQP